FAALAVFWLTGYRPKSWFRWEEARTATLKRIATLGAALLVLSTLLVGVTYGTYRTATFEEDTRVVVDDVLDGYEGLERLSVTIAYEKVFPFSSPERVTITVGYPPEGETPALAGRLAERIEALDEPLLRSDGPITVEVQYVAVDTGTSADPTTAAATVRSGAHGLPERPPVGTPGHAPACHGR
ncbi:MAG: hypothetical protein ABEH58_09595, partial [Haloplanus sp.]